jgi:hypothetical protein
MGTFALETLKKHPKDSTRRRMAINLAQAYKWGERPSEAARVIDGEDWSACSPEFQLAVALLRDDFDVAARLMKVVAAANLLAKNDYRDWPLFKEFRKLQVFLDAYQATYGHQLVPIEPNPLDAFFTRSAAIPAIEAAHDTENADDARSG